MKDEEARALEELKHTPMVKMMVELNLGTPEQVIEEATRLADLMAHAKSQLIDTTWRPDYSEPPPVTEEQGKFLAGFMMDMLAEEQEFVEHLAEHVAHCAIHNVLIGQVKKLSELREAIKEG